MNDDDVAGVTLTVFGLSSVWILTAQYLNMSARLHNNAQKACEKIGSSVVEFDRAGKALCENNATVEYRTINHK